MPMSERMVAEGIAKKIMRKGKANSVMLPGIVDQGVACRYRSAWPRYVALLRAVNVGGTGKLPMAELKSMCTDAGFVRVETYIASGNVVFDSKAKPSTVKTELEARLLAYFGKPVSVAVRTAAEMLAVVRANPFPRAEPKHTYAIFLDERPPRDALERAVGQTDREDGAWQSGDLRPLRQWHGPLKA